MTDLFRGWQRVLADIVLVNVAFTATNVLSFAYIVIAARTLDEDQFGVVNALLGFLTLAALGASSVQIAATEATIYRNDRDALAALIRTILRRVVPVIALFTVVAIPFSPTIGAGVVETILCGVVVALMFPGCAALGFLASAGRVRTQSAVNLAGTVLRVASGWPLMLLGFGSKGAVAGYLFNFAAVWLAAWWLGWRAAASRKTISNNGEVPEVRLKGFVMATVVVVFVPFTLDQFLVQAFAPALGGDYAATATVGKLVFFAAYPVIAVVYPHLVQRSSVRERVYLLAAGGAATVCIATGVAGLLTVYPVEIATILFAELYPDTAVHISYLAAGAALFATSVFCAHVLIAWQSRFGYLPSLLACAFGFLLFSFRHDSLSAIVENQLWVFGLQAILLMTLLVATLWNSQHVIQPRATGESTTR